METTFNVQQVQFSWDAEQGLFRVFGQPTLAIWVESCQ